MAGVPDWLRETRLRQVNPDTGRPWSQEYLVGRINEWAEGWTLYRSNYVNYEQGKQRPEPETLARFVAFWAEQGEPGPDLTPVEPSRDPQLVLADAINRQTDLMVSPGGDAHTPGLADLFGAITGLVAELRAEREERLRVRAEFAAFVQENRGMIEDLNGAVAELTLRLQRVEGRGEGPSADPVAAGAPAGSE